MCFGGGSMSKTKIKYEKPDFGPLPSLKTGEDVQREGAKYKTRETGMTTRSLLMPMGIQ
jgi:hypothetical protein